MYIFKTHQFTGILCGSGDFWYGFKHYICIKIKIVKKFNTTFLYLFFFSSVALAQLPVIRSTFTGPYTPINMPAATLSTASGDDDVQSAIPLGFTFNYLGINYTTIGVSTNGVASFSAVMSPSGTNNNLYVGAAPNLSLAPWWDNIWSDTILYQLQGPPANRTFTIQWTNSLSYNNTATQLLNFQIILHETSDVIEFSYGNMVPGIAAANESASIGIESLVGGAGDYLDAITGSAFTSNGMLNSSTQWPSHNFRFTPGTAAALVGGTYTVGLTGNYYSLSEAIADINHSGIAGPIVLSLIDNVYDVSAANGDNYFPMLIGPVSGSSSFNTITISSFVGTSTITSEGTNNGNCGNAAANNIINNLNEPILALVGASYISLQNIELNCSNSGIVDRGLFVINSSAIVGSQNNLFNGITVALNRGNATSMGIEQRAITTPTAIGGANSTNGYFNLDISNVYNGMYLNGNAAFPDLNSVIGNTSATQFNMIGAATIDDIGNGNTTTYGIRANNQNGVSIYNNEVRNVSQNGNSTAEGIILDAAVGSNNVYTNKVHAINYRGLTNTGNITGIRANLAAVGANSVNIFNNFIYDIGSSYAGVASATRATKGIYVQSIGGGTIASTINVDFNSVRMDNSNSPTLSGTCFEIGATNGPVLNLRNNIFSNFTQAQTGISRHFAMASTSATAVGNTGSISDYNNFYIDNTTNGFVGIGATTTFASLPNWQTAVSQDFNSLGVDPSFNSSNDLHSSALALNGTGNMTGITWVTNDIDNQQRSITPDIGADEFVPLLLDAGVTTLVAPLITGCYTALEQVTVTLKNFATVPLDFTIDPVTIVVNVTGSLTQTLSFTINTNILNANLPLSSDSSIVVPIGLISMTVSGIYTFDAYSILGGDGNSFNNSMSTVNINFSPGTATASPVSVCAGASTTLTLTGAGNGGTIQWQSSTDGGITWNNETGIGSTTTSYVVIPTANTLYQVLFCGVLISNVDTVNYYQLSVPVVIGDTICGSGVANLNATGNGIIQWYALPTGGNTLATGAVYSPSISATTTFYVTNTSGNLVQSVGLYDNSAGGGMSGSANSLIFDVFQYATLNGVYVYPAAAGNIVIDLIDSSNVVLNTVTVAVVLADVNQRTFIPLNFSLSPAVGMRLVRNATSVNLWRNNVGVNYPYSLPGVLSITASTAGNGFYYFFYDWQINYGCESLRVPVNAVVLAAPAISITAASVFLCAGDSTTITVTSTNSGYSYLWSPSMTLNTNTGSSVIATPNAAIVYTVIGNDSINGCQITDSILISVTSIPPIIISVADSVICNGSSDTLIFNYPTQSVGLYDNSAGGAQSGSGNNLIFDVLGNCTLAGVYIYPGAAGNVIIELQDNTNAVINSATFNATTAQINQRVYVPLNFSLTPGTGMQLVRNGTSINLWRNNVGVNYPYTLPGLISITTSTVGNGFYYFFYDWQIMTSNALTYVWSSIPTGYTGTNDTAIVTPISSTQYILTVTDTISGCTAQFNRNIDIATPIVAIIGGNQSICLGDTATLIAGYSGGDGNAYYVWSNNLGTNDSVNVFPSVNTNYSLIAIDGCGSLSNDTATVIVNTVPPVVGFTYSVTGLMTFTFTDASVNATSWLWDFGDLTTSTLQNPTHVYAAIGTYTVLLIASNGCGSDTLIQVILVDGIENNSLATGVSIFPNPAKNQFNVSFNNGKSSFVTIQFFNLQGKLIQEKQISNVKAGTTVPMNVEGYSNGMYLLKLIGEKESAVFKIIVQ